MGRKKEKRSVPCPKCGHNKTTCHGFDANGRQRYKCEICKQAGRSWTFNKRTGTPFHRLRTPVKEIIQIAQAYMENGSVASLSRTFKHKPKTIDRLMDRIAKQCAKVNDRILQNLEVFCVMLDELWSYVQKKENEQWGWNAIEAGTKLLLGFVIGPWTKKTAKKLVKLLRKRIKSIWMFISDGLEHYIKYIAWLFKHATYVQLVKHYSGRKLESLEVRHIQGFPIAVAEELIRLHGLGSRIHTAFVERLNLTERQSSSKLRRKTLCYAKRTERLTNYMRIFQAYYNLVRPHMSLKVERVKRTPAMASRLTDHIWTWNELLAQRI